MDKATFEKKLAEVNNNGSNCDLGEKIITINESFFDNKVHECMLDLATVLFKRGNSDENDIMPEIFATAYVLLFQKLFEEDN